MGKDLYLLLVYLFYGGAFFAIGVSITSRDTSLSKLRIARFLWILALFAYIHGSHEWYEMFLKINSMYAAPGPSLAVNIIKLGLALISFIFLLIFGVCVLGAAKPGHSVWLGFLSTALVAAAVVSIVLPFEGNSADYFTSVQFRIRNLVAFPGALLSGIGLILYSRTVKGVSSKGALNFTGAGFSIIIYGVFTGLIPSGTFISEYELPVELFRGLTALMILHFMMHALHTFDEERKAVIEERLDRFEQSEKLSALGRLAAGVAHEINNPLANLSLNLEILKAKLGNRDQNQVYQQKIKMMERDLERASRIARELLHVSSERESDLRKTDVISMVERAMILLGPRKKDYEFSIDVDETGIIMALPWKVEEALLNILINSMDATPKGGRISITSRREPGQVILEIADTGTGIDPEILPRIKEPFFTTKEVGQGTGLGLSICYGIMEQHGGQILVDSEPGTGTVVKLVFPERVGTL